MTSLILFIHACVVIAVPAFFGWVVLRRVGREHDWLVLIPGSVVVGAAALMALMNELRYWLEMSLATWFAYKALLAGGLLLLLVTRRPWVPRLAVRRGQRPWLLLAALGAVVTACFFGVPAARGLLHDAWWFHYPAATLVQDLERFPLPAVFAHDDPLYYHFGPDILAATWSHLLGLPVASGFVVSIAVFSPASFLLAYALVLRSSRSHVGGLAAATFLVVGGNLLFLSLPFADFRQPLGLIDALNSRSVDGLLKLMLTPSHCVGVPMVLVGVIFFRLFWQRPSWPLGSLLGVWLGTLTLVAEWYFFPLSLTLACLLFWPRLHRDRPSPMPLGLRFLPFAIAAGVGLFNNTYVAGMFSRFWVGSSSVYTLTAARVEERRLAQSRGTPTPGKGQEAAASEPIDLHRLPDAPPLAAPNWTPPSLIPLRLNLAHFGQVPSWDNAKSAGSGHIPLWHPRFLAECAPVLLLGLGFGFWLVRRQRSLTARVLLLLALISLGPPILLDWGYRSTDFLRFLTGAFSFSALLLGWLVGRWWASHRWAALTIVACCLVNPVVFGVLGLSGSTLAKLQAISESAGSLSDAAAGSPSSAAAPAATPETPPPDDRQSNRPAALAELAEQARRHLYPLTRGRDRAVVLVPNDQIPPTESFPEWLKLATLSRLQLPVGWHWNDSLYAAHYRRAVQQLDPESFAALDARWVIVTDLFDYQPGIEVRRELGNPFRFQPVATYRAHGYYLAIFRVVR